MQLGSPFAKLPFVLRTVTFLTVKKMYVLVKIRSFTKNTAISYKNQFIKWNKNNMGKNKFNNAVNGAQHWERIGNHYSNTQKNPSNVKSWAKENGSVNHTKLFFFGCIGTLIISGALIDGVSATPPNRGDRTRNHTSSSTIHNETQAQTNSTPIRELQPPVTLTPVSIPTPTPTPTPTKNHNDIGEAGKVVSTVLAASAISLAAAACFFTIRRKCTGDTNASEKASLKKTPTCSAHSH